MLCSNWASGIISSINYQLGSSNISLVERQGTTLWHQTFIGCETKEKRDKWQSLGGSPVAKITGVRTGDHDAVLQLSLPFSTIRNCMKKSYDTSLLSSPILIQIHFKPITAILSVASTLVGTTLPQPLPTQFSIADVIVRQDVLTNKSESMKTTLMSGSNLFSPYPYVHALTGTNRTLNNVAAGEEVQIDMSGFLNSDLLGIVFHCVETKYLNSIIDVATPTNNKAANPYSTLQLQNIKMVYNGSILHDLPANLYDAYALSISYGDTDASNTRIDDNGDAIAPKDAGNQYVYYLPFTAGNSSVYDEESFCNTPRYSQQPLTISFNANNAATTNYTFFSSYLYNGVVMTSKGNSNIFFT